MWFIDHNYIEGMNDMFKKVNAREKLIGWYHSGPKLRASDLEINELFKRYTPNPLLVIIDVHPQDVGVPTDEAVMALISPVPEDREGYITTMMERWKVSSPSISSWNRKRPVKPDARRRRTRSCCRPLRAITARLSPGLTS